MKENEPCSTQTTALPREMCGPHLICQRSVGSSQSTCQPINSTCENARKADLGFLQNPPGCDAEGNFLPTQCYPDGLCRCVDPQTGLPLALGFGLVSGAEEAESSQMNCQCALSYHNSLLQGCKLQIDYASNPQNYEERIELCIRKSMESSAFLPQSQTDGLYFKHGHARCLPNGNYDPIQCVDAHEGLDEICVCVLAWQEVGDHLTPNGTSAFPATITDLACFDESIHSPDYYRPCQKVIRDLDLKDKLLEDGYQVFPSSGTAPKCTPDGYYAKLQTDREFNHCTDRYGEPIETYANLPKNSTMGQSMNCECAIARKYLSPLKPKPKCCRNGNFYGMQCLAGFCYCVNEYGMQVGIEVEQSLSNTLSCPDFCCEEDSNDAFCQDYLPAKV